MAILPLIVTYYVDSTPEGIPCREENFIRRELEFPLPVEQTALVLVDLWNKHHIESWVERATKMLLEVIVPLIETSRKAGITIVFAPSPDVLQSVPGKYTVYEGKAKAKPPKTEATWPPGDFIQREGEYELYRNPRRQYPDISVHWPESPVFDMGSSVTVRDGDIVVASGDQLHDLCEERGILHLLYAGFATNWCILNRDYGVVDMSTRGYDIIIMRDATEGVEFPDTLEGRWATELAIREIEQRHGFSASNESFYAACAQVVNG